MITTIGRAKIRSTAVNQAACTDQQSFMEQCDQTYEKQITEIVNRVAANGSTVRMIMLSGPSASGKTTTSYKIKQGLENAGMKAVTISMDDFFKPRALAPSLSDGSKDFESIDAIDLPLLQSCLLQLIGKGWADLPTFNFKLGSRDEKTNRVELAEGSVAVVEGLHALDTSVTENLPAQHMLKLYISVSSDFVDDDGKALLTAREVRLIRRTIRDYHFRGSSPENTLEMWGSVCRGEDLYVRPFKKHADMAVNSVFSCEPCLFGQTAIKLFQKVPAQSEYYKKAQEIIHAVACFDEMALDLIPGSCVLREFVGGSDYYNKSGKHRTV